MKVKAPKTFDLFGGAPTGAAGVIEFAENSISTAPFGKFASKDKPYRWIGMNYVLVPADGKVEVSSFMESGMVQAVAPGSVPVKVNSRTNMVGSLYGADADFAFNIQVDPVFGSETEPGGGDENPPSGEKPCISA